MKYHKGLNERKMVVFVVQTSRYFGPCRILPYPAVSCRILPYLRYPAVSCRILPYPAYPAVSCRILPYPAVSCRILPYPAVSCRILPYPAVSCCILPYPAVSCRILLYRIPVTGKPKCVARPRFVGLYEGVLLGKVGFPGVVAVDGRFRSCLCDVHRWVLWR